MKVAKYYSSKDIRIEEIQKPEVKPDEILVEMKACGICGSDLMNWYLRSRAPLVLGHEPTGQIVEKGEAVGSDFRIGDRVFVHHHVACLTCRYCVNGDYTMCHHFRQTHIEPGGFAEYFKVPAPNLKIDTLKLPISLTYEEATLIEPVACCIRAQNKLGIQTGDTIAVIGAGTSGIIHAMLAKIAGVSKIMISDFVDYRLKIAEQMGADLIINSKRENLVEEVKQATNDVGADCVIVTAPNVQAFLDGIQICRRGGTICLFAPNNPNKQAHVRLHRLFFSEITIVPSYSASHIETRIALQLISLRRTNVKGLITHRFSLNRAAEAFNTATKSKESLKVVVLNEKL